MKVNIWKHIKCTTKQGYTMMELMVVIAIIGVIAAFSVNSFSSLTLGFENTHVKTERAVSDLKTIAYIDRLTQGCEEVKLIDNKTLRFERNGQVEIVRADKFGKEDNVDFELTDEKVILSIGGEEYCLPVLSGERNEGT